jgi:DNA-binding winged helix-turn-helix (wHTH) protein/tetratricopeptide (TPR) repeat protein
MRRKVSGEVELDLGRYELRRSGHRVKLEKKPMDLLIFLVGRRDRLVARQEIVAKLWHSDLFIDTERNINNIVRKIRAALGDDPAKPRFLETVVGKGYRFVGPIRIIEDQAGAFPRSDSPATDSPFWRGDRTSLAVLPLRPLGETADENGVCLGFADELIARLANLPGIDVLPTTTVLNVPTGLPPREIASRLGVRFLVHGAIQSSGSHTRLSIELFDRHIESFCFARRCELELSRLPELKNDIAARIASALNRPLREPLERRPRYSRDPLAYAQFMQGYRRSSSGDPKLLEEATEHLMNAVARDPAFALAHAELAYVCAARHFEFDPSRVWLEKAEFHCQRSLELDPELPEGHVAKAYLLWGPSKNFQHLEAVAELKRALALQKNLPHAYNRMGTILAHIGLLEHARNMYRMGSSFQPRKAVSHSIFQAYLWGGDYQRAAEELEQWKSESPASKYAIHFAPYLALITGDYKRAKALLEEAAGLTPEEPLIISLHGLLHAVQGRSREALACVARACSSPRSFGHAHHTHYQIACIYSVLGQPQAGFDWLERSVDTGFACWPFFLNDPYLENVRALPQFEILVSSLQGRYPDHLGLL